MPAHKGGLLVALLLFPAAPALAQVSDLTGTWVLNAEKSKWSGGAKPVNIMVTIDHKEPALTYTGTLVYAEGEDTRSFRFKGVIDGREYPGKRSFGEGKLVIRRSDGRTINSLFTSNDGRWTENTTTTVSRDGKVLRRSIRREGPQGRMQWTEVYDRR